MDKPTLKSINLLPSDSKTQSIKLNFILTEQKDKLNIQATNQGSNLHYVGHINAHPNIDFDFIKDAIKDQEYQCPIRNEQVIKLKVGGIVTELYSEMKLQNMKLKKTIQNLESDMKQMKQVLKSWGLNRNPQPKISMNSFTWYNYDSKNVSIKGNILTKKQANKNEIYRLQVAFTRSNTIKQEWSIKIHKITGHIMVGIYIRGIPHQMSVPFNKIGHGCYSIRQDGYCCSHSSPDFNYVKKNFKFNDGDVISMEYDPVGWKIKFFKSKFQFFEMPIIPLTQLAQNCQYRPCVTLMQTDSSVEIIPPEKL